MTTLRYISSSYEGVMINLMNYFVPLGVEGVLQSDNIRMVEFLHYLQFSILVALVLIHFLYCDDVSCFSDTCL